MKILFTPFILLFLLLASCSSNDSDEIQTENPISLPTISTVEVTTIGQTSVTVSGSASYDGGANIADKGIVWGLNSNPDLNSNKKSSGSGTGNFVAQITNLEPNTTYYFRSYATNSKGTSYGQQLTATTLNSEPQEIVYEGDVVLGTQQEVEDFGAIGYTKITGRLFCGGNQITSSKITSLQALSSIKEVGSLWINYMDDLENLNGLENITDINGVFYIKSNRALNDLSGLRNVVNIDGLLSIYRNDKLTSINRFDALKTVGDIQVFDNETLKIVDTFNEVSETRGFLFQQNEGVDYIGGFSKLKKLEYLTIKSNSGSFSVDSFHEVEEMQGYLFVNRNREMTSFKGFEKLVTSPEAIQFVENRNLTSISGFHVIKELKWLLMFVNGINSLNAFDSLEIADEIDFSTNFGTYNLGGFENLHKVNSLAIDNNENMSQLNGFNNLEEVGLLKIDLNAKLTKINGLTSLRKCTSIQIASNPVLTDFCGLQALFVNDIDLEPSIENNAYNPTKQEIAEGDCFQ